MSAEKSKYLGSKCCPRKNEGHSKGYSTTTVVGSKIWPLTQEMFAPPFHQV